MKDAHKNPFDYTEDKIDKHYEDLKMRRKHVWVAPVIVSLMCVAVLIVVI